MTGLLRDPDHWMMRAEEARARAEECGAGESQRTLLRIAESYEQLARTAATLAAETNRGTRLQVAYVGSSRRRLHGSTGTALPHPESHDPRSTFYEIWQFWIGDQGDPVLVLKRELAHLRSRRPIG